MSGRLGSWSIAVAAFGVIGVGTGYLIQGHRSEDDPAGATDSISEASGPESLVAVSDTPPHRRRNRWRGGMVEPPQRVVDSPDRTPDSDSADDEPIGSGGPPIEEPGIVRPSGGHEPAGFTPLGMRSFSTESETGWIHRRVPAFQLLQDPSAPESPPFVARAIYRAGMRGGTGPVMEARDIGTRYQSVYASVWVRFSDNWQGHPSGSNKILHIWIAGQNKVVFKAQGIGQRPLGIRVNLQGINAHPVSHTLEPNAMNRGNLSRGQWHRLEILVRSNTAGNSDGLVEWWVDGSLVASYSNIPYVRADQSHVWNRVSWNPTWGGVGGVLTADQSMDMDHIYVSGQ